MFSIFQNLSTMYGDVLNAKESMFFRVMVKLLLYIKSKSNNARLNNAL